MLMLSELAVLHAMAADSPELYIEELFFDFKIDTLFSFLKLISGADYEDTIEKILSFTENANELFIGPYTDISALKTGSVLLKANYAYKAGALAGDIYLDEETCENFLSLKHEAAEIMASLLLIPYEICFKSCCEKFREVLIKDNNEFIAAVT